MIAWVRNGNDHSYGLSYQLDTQDDSTPYFDHNIKQPSVRHFDLKSHGIRIHCLSFDYFSREQDQDLS